MQTHETFECKKCNSTVKMNSRASHNKKCDVEAVKTFGCDKCSYIVDRLDRLAKLMDNKHRENEKSKSKCTFCEQSFEFKNKLKIRERNHASQELKSSERKKHNVSPAGIIKCFNSILIFISLTIFLLLYWSSKKKSIILVC